MKSQPVHIVKAATVAGALLLGGCGDSLDRSPFTPAVVESGGIAPSDSLDAGPLHILGGTISSSSLRVQYSFTGRDVSVAAVVVDSQTNTVVSSRVSLTGAPTFAQPGYANQWSVSGLVPGTAYIAELACVRSVADTIGRDTVRFTTPLN